MKKKREVSNNTISISADSVLDNLHGGYFLIHSTWRYQYINKAGRALLGKSKEKVVNKKIGKLFLETKNLSVKKAVKEVFKDKKDRHLESYSPRLCRWFDMSLYPVGDSAVGIFVRDMTDQKTVEENLAFLAQAGKLFSSSLDYSTTLQTVAKSAIPHIADWCGVDMLDDGGDLQQLAVAHIDPKKVEWAKRYRRKHPPKMSDTTGLPQVIKTGKSQLIPLITNDMLVAGSQSKAELKLARNLRLTSAMMVPLIVQKKAIGAVSFLTTENRRIYTKADLLMAEELASRASQAIENARLFKNVKAELSQRRQLEETTIRQAALLDQTFDAILLWELKGGQITYWNKGAQELYGYTKKDAIGKQTHDLLKTIHPIPFSKIEAALQKTGRWEGELVHTAKNGEQYTVSCKKMLIREKAGKTYILETNRDITDRKKYESSLEQSERRLRLALDAGEIGVWEWNIQKDILVWSQRMYEFYHVDPNATHITVDLVNNFIHPEDAAQIEKALQDTLIRKKDFAVIYRIVTGRGETKWLTTRAIVLRDSFGKPMKMLGATLDSTEQMRLEKDKNDFVSIATHELKTPVTSLKAYAEVLQRKFVRGGDTTSASQLGKMNMQLDKLTSLIADLLDATKIESGKLQMHEERFAIDDLIAEIVEELQRTTEKHTIIIERKVKKNIFADRERTGQVLTNLISNAIKYSPSSNKILIQPSSTSSMITVCVKDFGVGIPKIKQHQVFERFFRVSGPKEDTFPGLGLGLYISSEIVKRQGGRIWVESTFGEGSTFCFTLPIKSRNK